MTTSRYFRCAFRQKTRRAAAMCSRADIRWPTTGQKAGVFMPISACATTIRHAHTASRHDDRHGVGRLQQAPSSRRQSRCWPCIGQTAPGQYRPDIQSTRPDFILDAFTADIFFSRSRCQPIFSALTGAAARYSSKSTARGIRSKHHFIFLAANISSPGRAAEDSWGIASLVPSSNGRQKLASRARL